MYYFTTFVLCASIALSLARPQFGSPFSSNSYQWGQNRPQFSPDRYFPNQGFPNQGLQNQGFSNQVFPDQGFSNQRLPAQSQNAFSGAQYFPNAPNQIQSSPNGNNVYFPSNPNQFNGRPPATTESPPFPSALPAENPEFLDCQSKCITTNQYNPVCGSDRRTYFNGFKLDCANKCRRQLDRNFTNIQIANNGACIRG